MMTGVLPCFIYQKEETHRGFLVPPRSDVVEPGLEPRSGESRPRALSTTLKWKRTLLSIYLVKTDYDASKEEISVRMYKTGGSRVQNRSRYHYIFQENLRKKDPVC